jgi:ABC-type multidrug transport system ATPase subunit
LDVDGIGVRFGAQEVLKSASFTAVPGQITCLMGRNGSGKTTLLRSAIGRVRPLWGRVLYKSRFFERPSLAELAREGLMFSAQDSALTDLFSVRDHLDAFGRVYGASAQDGIIHRLRLEPLLGQRPRQLSGGERQRVSLGLALLRHPDCLLMDEPFAGVAPADLPLIVSGLVALRDQGVAVVITGHEVEDLFAVSNEIIWVIGGTTHWLGTPAQARAHDQFRKTYLGPRAFAG